MTNWKPVTMNSEHKWKFRKPLKQLWSKKKGQAEDQAWILIVNFEQFVAPIKYYILSALLY